jgi:salicylate hydroxylase
MRVLVAGAGIGGLTAALALRQAGVDAQCYEQASVLREVGAGLLLGPNAVRVLRRLGLDEALRPVVTVPQSLDSRDWQDGSLLSRMPFADAAVARWGAPAYNVHRADLHDVLRAALGDEHLTLGARCVSIEEHGAEVTVTFADGRHATGDVLIGADGIHSMVREYVAGPDRPIWSRQISWRGLTPGDVAREAGLELRQHSFWGPRKQFVTYYVSAGRRMNWVGNCESDDDWQEESWSARGAREEALAQFEGWHDQVRALIAGTESIFKWAVFDRPPLETWTRGRVTLLGDAAHPMVPFLGQGASQSIEDGLVLARCLAAHRDDPLPGIEAYISLRRGRTAALQIASRDQGRLVQQSDQAEIDARNARIRDDPSAQFSRWDWIWGYDAEGAPAEG